MLVDKLDKRRELKTASFKVDKLLLDEFRDKCRKHKIKQVDIITKAMKKAIEEIDQLENGCSHE